LSAEVNEAKLFLRAFWKLSGIGISNSGRPFFSRRSANAVRLLLRAKIEFSFLKMLVQTNMLHDNVSYLIRDGTLSIIIISRANHTAILTIWLSSVRMV
uniref:NR LBD domain-containing protein n=1 Tax=Haemonchus placei TaxID=6290 RepID=A0A0N4W152_HAEPC